MRRQQSFEDLRSLFSKQQAGLAAELGPELVQMYDQAAKKLPENSNQRGLVETQRDILRSRQQERARQKRARMHAEMLERWTGEGNAFGSRGSLVVDDEVRGKILLL